MLSHTVAYGGDATAKLILLPARKKIAKREGEPPPTSLFAFNADSEGPRDVAYVG
jgi:hypothetical protein